MLCRTKLSFLLRKQAWSLSRSSGMSTEYNSNDEPVSLIFSGYSPSRSAIGIDLGTTKTCAAKIDIYDEINKILMMTPSIVSIKHDGISIGLEDPIAAAQNVYDLKKLLFRKYSDVDFQEHKKTAPYKIIEGRDEIPVVEIPDYRIYQPYEIAAHLLKEIKIRAGRYTENAVITVPSYSSDYKQLKKAGEFAGFKRIDVIKEPIAAALALESRESTLSPKVTAVYDFGGGKFEVSIIESKNGFIKTYSTSDLMLNGKCFDNQLLALFKRTFREKSGIDLRNYDGRNNHIYTRLRKAAVDAKVQLSKTDKVEVNIPDLCADKNNKSCDLNMELTRKTFENLVDDFLKRTIPLCEKSLEEAGIKMKDIDEVVLVGGITKIPKVKVMVEEIFGRAANQTFDPEEILAIGAAVAARKNYFS